MTVEEVRAAFSPDTAIFGDFFTGTKSAIVPCSYGDSTNSILREGCGCCGPMRFAPGPELGRLPPETSGRPGCETWPAPLIRKLHAAVWPSVTAQAKVHKPFVDFEPVLDERDLQLLPRKLLSESFQPLTRELKGTVGGLSIASLQPQNLPSENKFER